MSATGSVTDGVRSVASLLGGLHRAWALAALVIGLGAVTTLFEGAGIILILPFLQKLLGGPAAALTVSLPQLPRVAQSINTVDPGRQLPLIGGLILLAVAGREALAYANGLLKTWLSMRVANVHRARLHDALVSAQFKVSARPHHGYWQSLLHIEANRLSSLVLQLLTFGEMVVVTLTVLAIMSTLSPSLTAVVVGLLLAGALPLTRFFTWIYRSSRGRMDSRTTLNSYLAELLPFLAGVHVFGGQARERERFAARYLDMFRQDLRLQRIAGLIGPVYHVLGIVGVVGVVLLAVALTGGAPGAVGWVVPFILLFSRLLPIMNGLNHALGTMGDGLAAYRRFAGEIDFLRAHRMTDGARRFPARVERIEGRGVSFSYDGETPVLRDVSFELRRGRHVALTGPSGSGKSTLCLLLCRLHDPSKGEILVDGVGLPEFQLAGLRRAITLVEQNPVLLHDTIRANIAYGCAEATDADVRQAAREAHAEEFIERLPDGYAANVGNLGTALSGGQRQRIALARALLRRPQVLILDEATSAVDGRSELLIRQAIERQRGETTILSVAHRLSTIKDADEIHFVRGGQIVASGTFAELLAASDEFREYVRAQELSAAGAVRGEQP